MENQKNYKKDAKEAKFDIYLTKTIILASKKYFSKEAQRSDIEKYIINDEEYSPFIQNLLDFNMPSDYENIELNFELKKALESLSAIEQSVIFLLFQEELSEDEAAKILEIWSKSVSRIKIRAIDKLKKLLKGDSENE